MSATAAPTNDPMFDALSNSIATQRCVAFIGAGMSALDYPLWNDLIPKLIEGCDYDERFEDNLSNAEMAECLKNYDEEKYWKALRSVFARVENPKSIRRYHMLARVPFASYITTNLDPLLLDALSLHRNVIYSQYPWLPSCEHIDREAHFIHGRIDPESPADILPEIVFTKSEYDRAYDADKTKLYSFLQSVITERPLCFLGYGLADECLNGIFRICKSIKEDIWGTHGQNRPHCFAVVDQLEDVPATFEDEFGIRIVKYPVISKQYVGLDDVLAFLANARQPQMRRPTDGGTNTFMPRSKGPR